MRMALGLEAATLAVLVSVITKFPPMISNLADAAKLLPLVPLNVKLSVALGVKPEASIVLVTPVGLPRIRICRLVLCAVEPVYCSVPGPEITPEKVIP